MNSSWIPKHSLSTYYVMATAQVAGEVFPILSAYQNTLGSIWEVEGAWAFSESASTCLEREQDACRSQTLCDMHPGHYNCYTGDTGGNEIQFLPLRSWPSEKEHLLVIIKYICLLHGIQIH